VGGVEEGVAESDAGAAVDGSGGGVGGGISGGALEEGATAGSVGTSLCSDVFAIAFHDTFANGSPRSGGRARERDAAAARTSASMRPLEALLE
jgi:hypothetical protein